MSEKHSLTRFFPTYIKAQLSSNPRRYTLFPVSWKTITNQKGTPQDTAKQWNRRLRIRTGTNLTS